MQRSPIRRSKRNPSECLEPASQSSSSTAKIADTSAKAGGQPSALPVQHVAFYNSAACRHFIKPRLCNVSLASGEFAPANATTTIMPTATVNASAPSNMDMLYKMQQQISMLEQQLKYAQAHISESERHTLVTVPPHSTPPVTGSVDHLSGHPAISAQYSRPIISPNTHPTPQRTLELGSSDMSGNRASEHSPVLSRVINHH
ncbi:unnamed protein product [Ceratitis capitata]|uniref:(Mediterranean fruit fly) hypothetical protein n=1 Tax=Ceratitis capitata TaxID=7213 RepID=A0A811UUV3_CERCA|nr:unnamed protein product [Ceratitis capitata]